MGKGAWEDFKAGVTPIYSDLHYIPRTTSNGGRNIPRETTFIESFGSLPTSDRQDFPRSEHPAFAPVCRQDSPSAGPRPARRRRWTAGRRTSRTARAVPSRHRVRRSTTLTYEALPVSSHSERTFPLFSAPLTPSCNHTQPHCLHRGPLIRSS